MASGKNTSITSCQAFKEVQKGLRCFFCCLVEILVIAIGSGEVDTSTVIYIDHASGYPVTAILLAFSGGVQSLSVGIKSH